MKRITKWRAAAKRELIEPRGNKRYIRRDAKGRITESDEPVAFSGSPQDGEEKCKSGAG
jgi:hypothetical protein